jgi:hypothetical protein
MDFGPGHPAQPESSDGKQDEKVGGLVSISSANALVAHTGEIRRLRILGVELADVEGTRANTPQSALTAKA